MNLRDGRWRGKMTTQSDILQGAIGRRAFLARLIGTFVVLQSATSSRAADAMKTMVLYPEVTEPYRTVFHQILAGIRNRIAIDARALSGDANTDDVRRWMEEASAQVVIALGKRGIAAALRLPPEVPIVAGAILTVPADVGVTANRKLTAVSLASDPNVVFAKLSALAPRVKRVFVVYDPHVNDWLVERARLVADTYGFQVDARTAEDISSAVRHYRAILENSVGDEDALWLPLDPVTVDDGTVLPMVLKYAWEKRIAVISSSPEHAAKGVLFSLYPDNEAMGRRLAELALRSVRGGGASSGLFALTDLALAVNVRTAAHLRIEFSREQTRGFNLVFPAR